MRRSRVLWLSLILLLLAVSWYLGAAPRKHQAVPRFIIDASVDDDFAAVIQGTWVQFLFVFAARSDCFGDVRVKADYDLADRAMYDPRSVTVTVVVPERGSILKGALVHEWAHHVECQCAAQTEMRAAFIEAQGLRADTPWRLKEGTTDIFSSDWANIPSEQFAETTIVVALGERPVASSARITPEWVAVISAWAQKRNPACISGNWACPAVEFVRRFVPG